MSDIKPARLSACLVVRNEAVLIRRCLESLSEVADEIIVIHDGPCADATLDIVAEFGARVTMAPATGEGEPLRPLSYEQARGEWILQIDADEFLSAELRQALPELLDRPDVDAYEFFWPLFDGQRYRTHGWPHKRCLFRKASISYLGLPHSVVEVPGKVRKSNLLLEHRPAYNNFTRRTFKDKWLPWSRLQAQLLLKDFSDIPKFQYMETDWPRAAHFRRDWPLVAMALDPFVVMFGTLASGGWKAGWYAWKSAWFLACFRVAVDWRIFRLKST